MIMNRFLIIFIVFGFLLQAQTHRFIYNVEFKRDSTASEYLEANMALDINPENVKFYNYQIVQIDSLNKVRGQMTMMWDDDIPVIVRKKNSNKNLQYLFLDDLFVTETEDVIPWKLSKETKTSGNFTLQKATANWGGRNWIAWFTKEINLNEGPYKFRGLPGMIFEIEDDKGQYKFSMNKSYQLPKTFDTRELIENFAGKKPIKVSGERLKNIQLQNYENPLREFKETFQKNDNPDNKFYVMSVEVKSIDQFKELTALTQNTIRKNNNPIEIDKAIIYPVK